MGKAIGYVRVSTDEQAREGVSLENQRAKIEAYCSLNDLELVEILEDTKSAKNMNRQGLQDLLAKMKQHDIGALVIYRLDRLSRKVIDTLRLLESIEKNKVTLHSLTEKLDTQSPAGRFFVNILASLNQMERELIGSRTKDALALKIAKGERCGQVPYGFTVSKNGRMLVAAPIEQEVIALVRELRTRGLSLRRIARELTVRGYKPIGIRWYHKTVANILKRTHEEENRKAA
jgi:DNA invertase Pin-like site-specific DNA recombinase